MTLFFLLSSTFDGTYTRTFKVWQSIDQHYLLPTIGRLNFWSAGCAFALSKNARIFQPTFSGGSRWSLHQLTPLYSSKSHYPPHIPSSQMSSSTSMDNIRARKQALRKEIRAKVKQLSPEQVQQQSALVWQRLFSLPEYQQARSIGLFLSMPQHEINTDAALGDAIRNNKTVYVPEVGKDFQLADMELIQVILPDNDINDNGMFHSKWPRNKWGIPEPPESMERIVAKQGDLDLLIVPGLAFDAKGGRLGQGKGYYDRFIARMCNDDYGVVANKPKLVAVGLEPQFVSDDIPVTEHDFTMDMILLPSQTITVDK